MWTKDSYENNKQENWIITYISYFLVPQTIGAPDNWIFTFGNQSYTQEEQYGKLNEIWEDKRKVNHMQTKDMLAVTLRTQQINS